MDTFLKDGIIEETGQRAYGCLASGLQLKEMYGLGRCQLCPGNDLSEKEIEEILARAKYYEEHGQYPK